MRKHPSVLIIEPRHNTRTLLEMTLSQERMWAISAASVASALLQLRVLQPDLIIIGIDQKEFEPSTMVALIRTQSASPLLILGDADGVTRRQDGVDTLPCPFTAGQLCAKVAALLGRLSEPDHDDCLQEGSQKEDSK